MFNSHTSYQFGSAPGFKSVPKYAPVSKLDWSLDSTWTGFRFGVEEADSAAHFQWMTPMGESISGSMEDFDWTSTSPETIPRVSIASRVRRNDGTRGRCSTLSTSSDC